MLESLIWISLKDKRFPFSFIRSNKTQILVIYGLFTLAHQISFFLTYFYNSDAQNMQICDSIFIKNMVEFSNAIGLIFFVLIKSVESQPVFYSLISGSTDLKQYNKNRKLAKKIGVFFGNESTWFDFIEHWYF